MARIVRLERGDGYGFHLASESGNQFIRKIDEKSPAERAGIKDGDRLIGVNETCVIGLTHKEVVQHIRQSETEVALVLVSPTAERDLTDNDQMRLLWPRQVELHRKDNGFGFVLHSERIRKATKYYMTKITPNGAADEVGVANDDRLIKINDTFIEENIEHKSVVEMIKNKQRIEMLLCHRDTKMTLEEMDKMKVARATSPVLRDLTVETATKKTDGDDTPAKTPDNNNNDDSEKENQHQTVAEINSEPATETETAESESENSKQTGLVATISEESSSIGTTQSTQSSNVEFSDIDFSRMSLNELKASIRHRPQKRNGIC